MDYFHFANILLTIFAGVYVIICVVIYLADKKDVISNFLLVLTVLIFIITLFEPYTTSKRVKENISLFNHGEKLKCVTNNNDTYIVKNDKWSLEGDYCINNENKLVIRIDYCQKYSSK